MVARSWSEIVHDLVYHPSGRLDPSFEAHLHRENMERYAREMLSLAQERVELEREAFTHLQELFRDVIDGLDYGFEEMREAFIEGLAMSTRATVKAVSLSADSIVRAISETRDAMAYGFRQLGAAFSFGLSQIAWQQEQTNKLLTDVLAVLKAPRKTEADEMRERGDEAYRNGIKAKRAEDRQRWMDVALQAYADCVDKNPSDFSALYSIGIILFYERGMSEEALDAFRSAATFAEPYSPYHAALAWLQIAYIRRCRKEFEQAYEATQEAVRLQPDWAETHFQHAISCGLTGRLEEMKQYLKQAIILEPNYWFRACTDPDLLMGGA